MTLEIWKPVPNFPQKEVSTLGNVRWSETHQPIKPEVLHNGYLRVALSYRPKVRIRVHRLVMSTFCGQPLSDEFQINHKNGNKADNRLSNLEDVTQSENMLHRHRVLQQRNAEALNAQQIRVIRYLLALKMPQREIAEVFRISEARVTYIHTGKRYGKVR